MTQMGHAGVCFATYRSAARTTCRVVRRVDNAEGGRVLPHIPVEEMMREAHQDTAKKQRSRSTLQRVSDEGSRLLAKVANNASRSAMTFVGRRRRNDDDTHRNHPLPGAFLSCMPICCLLIERKSNLAVQARAD